MRQVAFKYTTKNKGDANLKVQSCHAKEKVRKELGDFWSTTSFPATSKEKYRRICFSAHDNKAESIKLRFEKNGYKMYCSIQNVLITGIKERKIEDEVN